MGYRLFVEELTKMVLESGLLLQEEALCADRPLPAGHSDHPTGFAHGPLDRLATVKA